MLIFVVCLAVNGGFDSVPNSKLSVVDVYEQIFLKCRELGEQETAISGDTGVVTFGFCGRGGRGGYDGAAVVAAAVVAAAVVAAAVVAAAVVAC
jgi:hypothetical protein